jgi:hypothetical protein
MTPEQIQTEVAKAVDLFQEGVFNRTDITAKLLDVVKDATAADAVFKQRLESLLQKVIAVRDIQDIYFSGNRKVLSESKKKEEALDQFVGRILQSLGYTKESFKKKYEQKPMF